MRPFFLVLKEARESTLSAQKLSFRAHRRTSFMCPRENPSIRISLSTVSALFCLRFLDLGARFPLDSEICFTNSAVKSQTSGERYLYISFVIISFVCVIFDTTFWAYLTLPGAILTLPFQLLYPLLNLYFDTEIVSFLTPPFLT